MSDKDKIKMPEFSAEEMIMPTNLTHQPASFQQAEAEKGEKTTPAPAKPKKSGIGGGVLLTILVLVLFLILAAGAYWYLKTQTNVLNNLFFVTEEEARGVILPTTVIEADINDGLDNYSEADDIDSISRDIESTDLRNVIREMDAIEIELNAALESARNNQPSEPAFPTTTLPEELPVPEEIEE